MSKKKNVNLKRKKNSVNLVKEKKSNVNLIKEKKNIFNFPNFLNKGTIVVILMIYLVVAISVAAVCFPKYDYTSVPNYTHTSSQKVSVYLKLSTKLTVDKNGAVEEKQTVTAYLNDNSSVNGSEEKDENLMANYEISGLTKNDTMDYFYSGSRSTYSKLPIVHTLVSDKVVKGGTYQKLFGNIAYETIDSEGNTENRTYRFAEEMMTLSKKEKNQAENTKKIYQDVLNFSISVSKSSDSDLYVVTTTANVKITAKLYHMDYQSWVVDKKGNVYPLVGFYNVYYAEKAGLTSVNSVAEKLEPEYIIVKAFVTNSYGGRTSVFYKEKFSDLIR